MYLAVFYILDFYYPYKLFRPAETAIQTVYAVSIGSLFLFAIPFLDRTFLMPRPVLVLTAILLAVIVFLVRMLYDAVFRFRFLDQRALIIGTGAFARELDKVIRKTPNAGMHVVGFVSESDTYEKGVSKNLHVVGSTSRLLSLISWHNINLVILAMDPESNASEPNVIYALMKQRVQIVSGIHLFEKFDAAIPYFVLDEHYMLNLMAEVKTHSYLRIKRLVDVVFSSLLMIILFPVFLCVSMILLRQGTSNVFYRQTRIGHDRREFRLVKFKSMMEGRDGRYKITRFGKLMRKYRIDEIPQLLNVLKGDMSLIGPRPEILYFVERCRKDIPFYDAVFTVRPGLTGWAQVNFSHVTDMRDYGRKFQYNLYYLKNLSLTLDLLILAKTVRTVLKGKGK